MSRASRRQKLRQEEKRKQKAVRSARPSRLVRTTAWVLAVAVVLSLGVWGVVSLFPGPEGSDKVIFAVNGHDITERELVRRENVLKYIYGLGSAPFDDVLRKEILDGLVDEVLIAEEVERRDLSVTEEDLTRNLDSFQTQLGMSYKTGLLRVAAKLKLRVSDEDIEAFAWSLVREGALYQAATEGVEVTEEDILALYEESKETLDEQGLSLEDVRDTLAQDALQKKKGEVYTQLLEELQAQAEITVPD